MRRFLTLVCLLCVAIPAGISFSGCTRNPAGNYCNGEGYGLKDTDPASITLSPQTTGISLAFGQTTQISSPIVKTCKGTSASVTAFSYGTTNNQLLDISPSGSMCAGTWNRNTGGGIANYTICNFPNPLPSTGGLPYAVVYITATAASITSNPVAVYIHPQVTSMSLVTTEPASVTNPAQVAVPQQCFSQNTVAQLDAQACYVANGKQTLLCAPGTVTSANSVCPMPAVSPDIIANATVTSTSAATITGAAGQNCTLSNFNNGANGATATVTLSGTNTIANGTPLAITAGGVGATAPPTTAVLSTGTATSCSGTISLSSILTPVPSCSSSIGTLSFSVGNAGMASINQDTNQITAELPGTTVITAAVAGGSSSAGYFSVCPPASISLALANGQTTGTITQGVQQNLTTTIVDTQGNPLTGLALDYQTTDPLDIGVSGTGGISAIYPGVASIYAICQPSSCNPAPINETGLFGTGLSISSNPVTVTTPGTASDYVWFASPGQSQYFAPIELLSGSVGATVRLPYVPNSFGMDRTGTSLYFGSAHELMIYNTFSNTQSKIDANVPGIVLAVAPNNSLLLINDQARQLFYIYSPAGSNYATFGGMANAAAWTPDSKTLYITDNSELNSPTGSGCPATPLITGHSDTLYVYNVNTGWTTYPLPPSHLPDAAKPSCQTPPNVAGVVPTNATVPSLGAYPPLQTPAVTIPSVGAYMRGTPTVAHTWCPAGTVGGALQFYPQADSIEVQSDALGATTDGKHILSAALDGGPITLSDIGVSIPTGDNAQCPGAGSNTLKTLFTKGELNGTVSINQVVATAVNQVLTSPASNLAFITYAGTTPGALLPYYKPGSTGTAGTAGYVTLMSGSTPSTAVTAPVAGAFSPDDSLFFVSTAGDNMVHYISVPTLTDTQQVAPNLPACTPISAGGNDVGCTYTGSGTVVPATGIEVKPRSTT